MRKKGVSEVVAAVLLISLVITFSLLFAYFYNDFIYEQQDRIEGTVFEELGLQARCNANWDNCGEWTDCEINYNLDDLIVGKIVELEGLERRICKDTNECANDKIEERKCSTRELVVVEVVEENGKEYINLEDKVGNLISRINKDEKAGTLHIDLYV